MTYIYDRFYEAKYQQRRNVQKDNLKVKRDKKCLQKV